MICTKIDSSVHTKKMKILQNFVFNSNNLVISLLRQIILQKNARIIAKIC